MPTIYDNIENELREALRTLLGESHAAEMCVGYLNLRGWDQIADQVDRLTGAEGQQVRLLVGMTRTGRDELEEQLAIAERPRLDNAEAKRRETRLLKEFQDQLTTGLPSTQARKALRRLSEHLRSRKAVVKLYLRYPLHAKLYLLHRKAAGSQLFGILGSSNLTAPGLYRQGELNIDVTDQDACNKLLRWFEDRWNDPLCVDISDRIAQFVDESWAREDLVQPYHVYLKIAYHLAFEALEAPLEYRLPQEFREIILDFQEEAVLRLRRLLEARPLAILADVVGLGKTLAATAVARLYQDEVGGRCVICCLPKLCEMWRGYVDQYHLAAEVVPYSRVQRLREIRGRCRLLIADESHNLRNRETIAWAAIKDFVTEQEAKVLLLSATPYNKHYEDLGSQLRLGLDEKADLGIKPEQYFKEKGEQEFISRFQAPPTSLLAFEQSTHPEDWEQLLKLFMVRRTRAYLISRLPEENFDKERDRWFIQLGTGMRSYFPVRTPIRLEFPMDDKDANDQYARLFNPSVVATIESLHLPRYGLGAYIDEGALTSVTSEQATILDNLSTAGARLIGYCRTGLLKRLESSGHSFLLSLARHALRNLVYVHAIGNGLDLPIGTQDSSILDTAVSDWDPDAIIQPDQLLLEEEPDQEPVDTEVPLNRLQDAAGSIYEAYARSRKEGKKQFRWLPSSFFLPQLREDLLSDADALMDILRKAGQWDPGRDAKLRALADLLKGRESKSKVLVFSQFADTALYVAKELQNLGVEAVEAVTADSPDPADQVRRFSPESNLYQLREGEKPIRVLVATEVLSEGQNCQDAAVVVNYDLPWAIIRLIQRAGRVDRIGQDQPEIRIYSCLPEDGVEDIINLRKRLLYRLKQNREVIGTDEQFFEEEEGQSIRNIYAEQEGVFDTQDFEDVDIPSRAKAIWDKAVQRDPAVANAVKALPDQVFTTKEHVDHPDNPKGVLVYFKTADGFDSACYVDEAGKVVTQSLSRILDAAACPPEAEALPVHHKHHDLVANAIKETIKEHYVEDAVLGPRNSVRRRVYERLSGYRADLKANPDLFSSVQLPELEKVITDIYRRRPTEYARDVMGRRLREGISDQDLAQLAIRLRDENRLCVPQSDADTSRDPRLICSMGMFEKEDVQK